MYRIIKRHKNYIIQIKYLFLPWIDLNNDEGGVHPFNTIKEAEKEIEFLKQKDVIIRR